ncbi:hypothetical protein AKJ51_00165 [candidate division MSBL1 archaeon SCGC-AAA382A20]|uniref:Uncharacterized protein n=1 Tax=candidate division MSBL1 archaeon SCGC-AAA382A20 TaxID=1698280 RepID=A0A133VMX7_9EURY|nr:hypothetical protein AKJ51_00165 [candidate division MSBL1 archaeon SCGC-AAA382A20]
MSDIISALGRRILFSLAEEGKGQVGEIAERIDADDSSIYNKYMPGHLTELELVQWKKKRKKKTGPKPKIYSLSIKGLVALFNFMDDFWKRRNKDRDSAEVQLLEDVSKTHEFLLPKIFGKWDSFEKRGVKDAAIESFKLIMGETEAISHIELLEEEIYLHIDDNEYLRSFTVSFFSLPLSGRVPCDKIDAWIDILASDDEVVNMISKFYRKQEDRILNLIDARETMLERIKDKIPEPENFHLPFLFHEILEVLKDPSYLGEEIEITSAETEEIEITPVETDKLEIKPAESEEEQEHLKNKLLLALDKLEGEEGAEISDLAAEIGESISKTEDILSLLFEEDKAYEPTAGKFKRLG